MANRVDVNMDGIDAVARKLEELGFDCRIEREGRKKFLAASRKGSRNEFRVRVKVKRERGHWHSRVEEGEDNEQNDAAAFWVFVNLQNYERAPTFWIVPEPWIRKNIREFHQKYLDRRGGHRRDNDESDHHSIDEGRIAEWEDRWDIIP